MTVTDASEHAALRERAAEAASHVLGLPRPAVEAATTLFELPGFDSLAIVAILDRLENGLRVEVEPELIVPEAFESLDTLARLFGGRTAGGRA
jgi:acyl carrier protein